jgi:hypothetical protein
MTTLAWLATMAMLCLSPHFVCTSDKRHIDGERYTTTCGGLYQRPETWSCVEVAR